MKKSEKILSALTIAFSIASVCLVILNFIGKVSNNIAFLFIGLSFLSSGILQISCNQSTGKTNAFNKIGKIDIMAGIIFIAVMVLKIFFKINL